MGYLPLSPSPFFCVDGVNCMRKALLSKVEKIYWIDLMVFDWFPTFFENNRYTFIRLFFDRKLIIWRSFSSLSFLTERVLLTGSCGQDSSFSILHTNYWIPSSINALRH
jgi:hypothetical protein